MVELSKTGLVAEVELMKRGTDVQIGTGLVERTKAGYVIVHVDLRGIEEYAHYGFSIGPITITDAETGNDEDQRTT